MADIFDLAKSIMAQKTQASQGYSSPLEQLPLQVAQIMDTRAKEKRVSLKNDSVLLSNLIKNANTEDEINNAEQLAKKFYNDSSKHESTALYGEAINQQFKSKKDAYNKFVASAEWFDNMYNTKPDEKGLDSTDYGLAQINDKTWNGLANEKFGKNVNQLSDIENIDMMSTISKGGSDKFRSTRGWDEWSTVQQGMDKQFLSMISNEGFDTVANKYNISNDVVNKINQSFDNNEDKNKALAVIIAESGGKSDAINYNYGDTVKGRSYFDMSSEELQSLTLEDINKRREELERMQEGFDSAETFGFKYHKGKSSYTTLKNQHADYKQRLEDTLKAHITGDKISNEEAMGILLGDFEGTKKTATTQIRNRLTKLNSDYSKLSKMNADNIKDGNNVDFFIDAIQNEELSKNSTESDIQTWINNESDKIYRQILAEEERQRLWTGIEARAGEDTLRNVFLNDEGKITKQEQKKDEVKIIDTTKGGQQQVLSKPTKARIVDKKTFTGSEVGRKIFDIRENVSNIVSPYKDKLRDAIKSSPEFKKAVFSQSDTTEQKQKWVQVKSKEYKSQIGQINSQLKEVEEKEMRARAQTKASPNNKYYKEQLDQILKKKRNLELKKLNINRALKDTEKGTIHGVPIMEHHIGITDEDLFNLIAGGNLKLKELGIPNNVIIEIKKAMKNYKNFIPHVSKNERMEYNFPNKINLNF